MIITPCSNGKFSLKGYQGFFGTLNSSSSTSTLTTASPENEDSDTQMIVIVLVSCIGAALFVSALVALFYCYRKHVLCFSNPKHKQNEVNIDTDVWSISPNANNTHSQGVSDTVYGSYRNEAFKLEDINDAWNNESEPQVLSPFDLNSSADFIEIDINSNTARNEMLPSSQDNRYPQETSSNLPMQGFISSLLAQYEQEAQKISLEAKDTTGTGEDEDEFQSSEQMKDQGMCWVKSTFNPYTLEHRSTPDLLEITKNEELIVLQNDFGSGWTCVRNPKTLQTGFVPTSNLNFFQ